MPERISPEESKRILSLPLLTEMEPVVLEGGFSLGSFEVKCGNCQSFLPESRGTVHRWGKAAVSVDAQGICHACKNVTYAHLRLYQGQGEPVRILIRKNGKWISGTLASSSRKAGGFWSWLRRALGFLTGGK